MPNEILTLQFGHYANFVGAHWWNLQEASFKYDPSALCEINHDALFREGLTPKGEVTFTPRLLLADLKGSLKSLSEEGDLYRQPRPQETGDVDVVTVEEKHEKIDFQKDLEQWGQPKKIYDLESEVRVWSDFLYARFHPRTVNIIRQYRHSGEKSPFDIYPLGANLWKSEQFGEDFVDKIRNYIEECDSFQGFQVLLDCCDGFSGLGAACVEYLSDEYATKAIFGAPLLEREPQNHLELLNLGLCYDSLAENSSLFIPLGARNVRFDYLNWNPDLPYHSSAILAATLDTITLNYRLKQSRHALGDLSHDFSNYGRKCACASVNFPFPLKTNEDLIDCLNQWEGPLVTSVTPNCPITHDDSLQLITLRGVPETRLKRPPQQATNQRDFPAYRCDNVKEMVDYFLACTCHGARNQVSVCGEQLTVKTPFPRFFDKRVGMTGDIGTATEGCEVEGVNMVGGIHSGKFVGGMIDELSKNLSKVKYKRFHQFNCEGFECDQFKECFDRLLDLKDCYEDNYLI